MFERFAKDLDAFLGYIGGLDASKNTDTLKHAADSFGDDVGGVCGVSAMKDSWTVRSGRRGDGAEKYVCV